MSKKLSFPMESRSVTFPASMYDSAMEYVLPTRKAHLSFRVFIGFHDMDMIH